MAERNNEALEIKADGIRSKMCDDIFEEFKRLVKDQVAPWGLFNAGKGIHIKKFDGNDISISGIKYSDQSKAVFFNSIEPFIEDVIRRKIKETVELAKDKEVPLSMVLDSSEANLSGGIDTVYHKMQEIDRRLRGGGDPKSVPLRDVSLEIKTMKEFLDRQIKIAEKLNFELPEANDSSSLKLKKNAKWYQSNTFKYVVIPLMAIFVPVILTLYLDKSKPEQTAPTNISSGQQNNLDGINGPVTIENTTVNNYGVSPDEKTESLKKYVEPNSLKTQKDYFEVQSKLSNVLWSQSVSGEIVKGVIADINNDQIKEIIIGIGGQGKDSGKLIVFDWRGEVLWEFYPDADSNYTGGKSGKLCLTGFEVCNLFSSKEKQIVSYFMDSHGWYSSCLCVNDASGSLSGRYWHSGHIHHIKIGSQNNEFPKSILVGAINNDLKPYIKGSGHVFSVFLLDSKNIDGESPPYHGKIGKGTQKWYGVLLPKNEGISRLDIIDSNKNGKNEICVWTSNGHIFYLDFDAQLIGKGLSDGAKGEARFNLIQ